MRALLDFLDIKTHKQNNTNGWRNWVLKILRRRNILVSLDICAYGKSHLIDRVQPIGGGYVFWSKACDGCQLGKLIIKNLQTKIKPKTIHCAFLKSGLLTLDAVKPNMVYKLPARDLD